MRRKRQLMLQRRGENICRRLADIFRCEAVYSTRQVTVIRGLPLIEPSLIESEASHRFHNDGFNVRLEETDGLYSLNIATITPRKKFPWVNVILFGVTVLSVLVTAAFNYSGGELLRDWSLIHLGIPFTFWLILILLVHEFGHYTFSRLRGVDASLPYFIPAPIFFLLGTLGAVIVPRAPFKNRRDLLDMAAAGPIAGFVVALIAVVIGLRQSEIIPIEGATGILQGDSLLFRAIQHLVVGSLPEGMTLARDPIAFAGWAGLLVTMLNLLPVSSLDGGHISYALLGKYHRVVAYATVAILIALSFFWPVWLIWVGLILFIGPEHPSTMFDEFKLGAGRRLIAVTCFIIFFLCFIPVPIRII